MTHAWEVTHAVADKFVSRFEDTFLHAVEFARNTLDMSEIETALRTGQPKLLESELGFALAALDRVGGAGLKTVLYDTLVAAGEAAVEHAKRSGKLLTANQLKTLAQHGEQMLAPYVKSEINVEAFAKDRVARRVARLRTADNLFDELAFDFVNPKAVQWAQEESGRLIKGITNDTRASIQDIIRRSYTEGITTGGLKREIREHIGLLQRDSNAVYGLGEKLKNAKPGSLVWAGKTKIRIPNGGMPQDLIDKRLKEYGSRLLNARARTIARTETIAASNEGQRQLWEQSVQKGLLRGNELRKWLVTPDDRLCDQCSEMRGQTAPISGAYDNGLMGPPLHPNCRCAVGLIRAPKGSKPPVMPNATPVPQPEIPKSVHAPGSIEEYNSLRHLVPKTMSQAETEAVMNYRFNMYRDINDGLRKGFGGFEDYIKATADSIKAVFAKTPVLDAPLTVYRGLYTKRLKDIKVGDVWADNGFVSTSTSQHVATQFPERDAVTVFNITIPKGKKALHIDAAAGKEPLTESKGVKEREILLPNGTAVKVTGISKSTVVLPGNDDTPIKVTTIHAEVI